MSFKHNKINVIDLEATCWVDGNPPSNELSEIIEIGITTIETSSLSIIRSNSVFIRPKFSSLSDFCTELTGITNETLKSKGKYFDEGINRFKKLYGTKKTAWFSWGNDKKMLIRNCELYNVEFPIEGTHFNLSTLFSIFFGLEKEVGMKQALEMLSLDLEGKHHSGKDDSYNTAKILIEILKNGNGMICER